LQHNVKLATRIIHQTHRRVFEGQSVAASDKVVSMVESHTDVIVKGGREVEYGHKAFLSVGRSSMVLDLVIERGNPADVTRVQPLLQRHQQQFGCMPRQASFDAGFTSNGTVELATRLGIEAAFARRSGVDVSRAVTNSWLYRQLMRFRAGIEGVISFLKHSFGLERCSWRGSQSCQAYAWASALAANVLIAARLAMA
jgi:IS5 family transposase